MLISVQTEQIIQLIEQLAQTSPIAGQAICIDGTYSQFIIYIVLQRRSIDWIDIFAHLVTVRRKCYVQKDKIEKNVIRRNYARQRSQCL